MIEISSLLPMLNTCPMAFGSLDQAENAADDVTDVGERSCLRAVTVHLIGSPGGPDARSSG